MIRTHQLSVSISLSFPLAKRMTSMTNMASMTSKSRNSMSRSCSMNCVAMMGRDSNCLANH